MRKKISRKEIFIPSGILLTTTSCGRSPDYWSFYHCVTEHQFKCRVTRKKIHLLLDPQSEGTKCPKFRSFQAFLLVTCRHVFLLNPAFLRKWKKVVYVTGEQDMFASFILLSRQRRRKENSSRERVTVRPVRIRWKLVGALLFLCKQLVVSSLWFKTIVQQNLLTSFTKV